MPRAPTPAGPSGPSPWSSSVDALAQSLGTGPSGLSAAESRQRRAAAGRAPPPSRTKALRLFLQQFKSPLVLILVFAATVSVLTRDWVDAGIVLAIVLASAALSFQQEYRAGRAIEKMLARIAPSARVLRDGQPVTVAADDVVPGDVLVLSAGSLIAADARVIDADDFFVNQAVMTGETFPVEKHAEPVDESADDGRAHERGVQGHQCAQRHRPGAGLRDRGRHGVRRDRRSPGPARARDGVRARHPPLRAVADAADDAAGARHLCRRTWHTTVRSRTR